ncbi:MAG: polysaccharide deacetylase family protein [Myxococcales bacterium]|nr:polysaccharide deacetylase family protein [Myxococcales bacterium]
MRLAALSVDLDEVPNYFGIHGLPAPTGAAAHAVYDLALARLDDFARAHGLPLTLFAIGADMVRDSNALRLCELRERGHEIANHSLDHLYDLTRQPRSEMLRQVDSGITVLAGATGHRPTGFRAPGYTTTDELFDVLAELGVAYDSSVFPCPPYYLAKAAAMGAIRLRGRRSRSILDAPGVLSAPTRPYRIGRPYFRRGSGLVELPIQVTRGLRLPFIGTTLTLAGASRARLLTRMVIGEPLVNLELHGIDVLDSSDGLAALTRHQPDVRVPLRNKLDALGAVVESLKRAGYSFVRLDEAARAIA